MYLPNTILAQIKKEGNALDNRFFIHAEKALCAMNKLTADTFCYDDVSRAVNTLERVYKGFLQAAENKCEWYSLPSSNFLSADHDILGMVLEIKDSFPDVFPRQERQEWRDTKTFLKTLRQEYTNSRYASYPEFHDFSLILSYVQSQYDLITDYIKEGNLDKENEKESEHVIDY